MHGIDEEGKPFIVNHEGHFVEVLTQCPDPLKEDCVDWSNGWISIPADNFAEIEAEIDRINNKSAKNSPSRFMNVRKNYYDRVTRAKEYRSMM